MLEGNLAAELASDVAQVSSFYYNPIKFGCDYKLLNSLKIYTDFINNVYQRIFMHVVYLYMYFHMQFLNVFIVCSKKVAIFWGSCILIEVVLVCFISLY